MLTTLDITRWKSKGDQLRDHIVKSVQTRQKKSDKEYCNELLMTEDQFHSLAEYIQDYVPQYLNNFFIFITPYNAMEIRVKGATDFVEFHPMVDTVPESLSDKYRDKEVIDL